MKDIKRIQKSPWLLPIVVTLVIVLLAVVFLYRLNGNLFSVLKRVSVNYITPDGTIYGEKVFPGNTVKLEDGPEYYGYVFIGWKDAEGREETRSSIPVYCDTWYSAVYAVALKDDHSAYLSCDENGFVHPDMAVTRGELADIIASFLAVDVNITDTFADVTQGSIYYYSANKLKTLRVVDGSNFYPNEAASLLDALEILSAFYPKLSGDCNFEYPLASCAEYEVCANAALHGWIDCGDGVSINPNGVLTRKDIAILINRVFGRSVNIEKRQELVGSIPDADPNSDGYFDLVEATVPHEADMSGDTEQWKSIPKFDKLKSGLRLIGLDLYFVKDDGTILTNGEADGFRFDMNGHYTSGDTELDKLVRDLIETELPEDGDTEAILRNVYEHIISDFTFVSGRRFSADETIPTEELAKKFLEERKGNCYYYAAAFCMAARALGYNSSVYKGNVEGSKDAISHGWCGTEIDGRIYITDPELAIYLKTDIFMISPEKAKSMGFVAVGN